MLVAGMWKGVVCAGRMRWLGSLIPQIRAREGDDEEGSAK
jgi:hypothetical protein